MEATITYCAEYSAQHRPDHGAALAVRCDHMHRTWEAAEKCAASHNRDAARFGTPQAWTAQAR